MPCISAFIFSAALHATLDLAVPIRNNLKSTTIVGD